MSCGSNVISMGGGAFLGDNGSSIVIPDGIVIPEGSLVNYKTIKCFSSTGTADAFYPFLDLSSNSIYQVPTGKIFLFSQVLATSTNATTGIFQLGFDTTTFTAGAVVGGMTAPVYEFGQATLYGRHVSSAGVTYETVSSWRTPNKFLADKFPFVQCSGAGIAVYIIGQEV